MGAFFMYRAGLRELLIQAVGDVKEQKQGRRNCRYEFSRASCFKEIKPWIEQYETRRTFFGTFAWINHALALCK